MTRNPENDDTIRARAVHAEAVAAWGEARVTEALAYTRWLLLAGEDEGGKASARVRRKINRLGVHHDRMKEASRAAKMDEFKAWIGIIASMGAA